VPASFNQKEKRTGSKAAPPRAPNELWGDERSLAFGGLTVVVLAALALRLHGLNLRPFSLGEALSVEVARLPGHEFWRTLLESRRESPLCGVVLRGWIRLGSSEAWIRGLSVLGSVATLPFVYAIGKRLHGVGAGLIAAVLLAINLQNIRCAQEANSFGLALLLATAATYFFVTGVQDARTRDWKWYCVIGVASVYANFVAALVLLAHWFSLRALKPCRVRNKFYGRALKWMAATTLPLWVVLSLGAVRQHASLSVPMQKSFAMLVGVTRSLGVCGWLTYAAYAACWAIAAWALVQNWQGKGNSGKTGKSKDVWRFTMALAWLLVPAVILLLLSIAYPVFSRFSFICLPAAALAAAAGIDQLRPRILALPAVAVFLVLAAFGLRSYASSPSFAPYPGQGGLTVNSESRPDFRTLTWFVLGAALPKDAILFDPAVERAAYDYYASRFPASGAKPAIVFPGHGPAVDYLDLWQTPQALGPDFYTSLARNYDRVWLVEDESESPTRGMRNDISGSPQTAQRPSSAGNKPGQIVETNLVNYFRLDQVLHFPAVYLKLYERVRTPEQSDGISH
jgi:mannosyltransferase